MGEEGKAKGVAVVATAIKCTIQAAVWLSIKATARYSKAPWYYFLTSLTRERGFTPKVNTNFGTGGNHLPCASRRQSGSGTGMV